MVRDTKINFSNFFWRKNGLLLDYGIFLLDKNYGQSRVDQCLLIWLWRHWQMKDDIGKKINKFQERLFGSSIVKIAYLRIVKNQLLQLRLPKMQERLGVALNYKMAPCFPHLITHTKLEHTWVLKKNLKNLNLF